MASVSASVSRDASDPFTPNDRRSASRPHREVLFMNEAGAHVVESRSALEAALARVMPAPRLLAVSARTGTGIADWAVWLEPRRPVAKRKEGAPCEA